HGGIYKKIKRPKKLVFTWNSEFSGGETQVTLDFKTVPTGTELTLTHEGFKNRSIKRNHQGGWTGCLKNLKKFVG
ncbi:MAG: hypothetical protein JWQ35_120, partial [Bacteriovoracaceae bacterium]|nr:hypothetical protein [Bacteriovoracaceae bacterium]